MTLWLVRHGSTAWSEAGRFNGATDVSLSDRGRAEARDVAERLPTAPAGVWSSPARRAVETARLAAGDAVIDDRLRELYFGDIEGSRWDELPVHVQESLLDFDGFAAPSGESVTELRERVLGFVGSLPDGDHVVFTHGGVIRLLLRLYAADRAVNPGEIVELEVSL